MANRPNILKLATKISLESLTYTGITYKDPEYRILAPIVDDDMCRVMMHLRLETNRTLQEVAKRCNESESFVKEQLDKLIAAGIVRSRKVGACDCYYYPIWVPGIMEGILSNREQCDRYPDLGVHPPPSRDGRPCIQLRQARYVHDARHARHECHREQHQDRVL